MLSLASSSILLLALPQTDNEADGSANLPKGDERSEQFVLEANEYFQLIDVSLDRCFLSSGMPFAANACGQCTHKLPLDHPRKDPRSNSPRPSIQDQPLRPRSFPTKRYPSHIRSRTTPS